MRKELACGSRLMGMSFAEAWSSVGQIEGWLSEDQARRLYAAAQCVSAGEAIVEIGSHHGRSTVILASAKEDEVQLVAVDPFDDARWGGGQDALDIFRSNLSSRGLNATLIRALGAEAGTEWSGGPVGLLFVDGAHDYKSVAADLEAWRPNLSESGIVLMHDTYSSPGVTRAMFREMFRSRDFRYIGSSRSLSQFKRQSGSRLLSDARMLVKIPWFIRNLGVKIARRNNLGFVERALGHRETALPY